MDMVVHRKPGRPRKLIPKEIACKQTSFNTQSTETMDALSLFKQENDQLVRRKRGRPIKDKDKLILGRKRGKPRKSIPVDENNCNKPGDSLISDIVKQNDSVRDGLFNHPIWSGSISVSHGNLGRVDGLAAYMSRKENAEVLDAVQLLPALLDAEVLAREDVWPTGFHDCPPTDDIIDLYILPAEQRSEDVFDSFLDAVTGKDVVLRAVYADVSILIFSSLQLIYPYWRTTSRKYYLWAVIEGKNLYFPHLLEGRERIEATDSILVDVDITCVSEFPCTLVNKMIKNHPTDRAANSDLSEQISCGSMGDPIRPEVGLTETTYIRKYPQSASNEVIGEESCSESTGASVLEMAKTFDDVTSADEISPSYSVEPKYTQILEAILKKHGDIAQDCPIQCTKMLTSALERICKTVQALETMQFVSLRRSHLRSMLSAITDAELVKLDVKWLRDRYEELDEAIGRVKEYIKLKDTRKEMEKKIAVKKKVISWKKDEVMKLESEIEMLESEVAQVTSEKETVSSVIRNVTSKCKHFRQNPLTDGLL